MACSKTMFKDDLQTFKKHGLTELIEELDEDYEEFETFFDDWQEEVSNYEYLDDDIDDYYENGSLDIINRSEFLDGFYIPQAIAEKVPKQEGKTLYEILLEAQERRNA